MSIHIGAAIMTVGDSYTHLDVIVFCILQMLVLSPLLLIGVMFCPICLFVITQIRGTQNNRAKTLLSHTQ